IIAVYSFVAAITQLPGKAWTPNASYSPVPAAATTGVGTGMTVRITTDASGDPTATMMAAGTGYAQGETVTFDDPAGVGDPLTVTVADPLAAWQTGPVISTRAIAQGADPQTADSTGSSGAISLTAPAITLGPGTRLLANVIAAPGSAYTAGNVSLTALGDLAFTFSLNDVLPWQVHDANATITIDGATIDGNDVTISASSTTTSFAGYDVFGSGWESAIAGTNVGAESDPTDTELTFADGPGGNGSTITRSAGDWLADHFQIAQQIAIIGSQYNDATDYTIANVTPTVITLAANESLVNETDDGVSVVKQVLSSILPQNTPVATTDSSGAASGSTPSSGYAASTLTRGLAQLLASGSLLDLLLEPPLNAFFGVTSHATSTIQTLGATTIDAAG
ncbi:MAG: hypothetical protein ACRDL8_15130, partial [Solirubrobacteraceae bacterium]